MENNKSLYTYRLRNRPAMYGTVPDGRLIDLDVVGSGFGDYGTITYDRPLSPKEIYKYELVPIHPEPVLPLYDTDTLVIDLRNGEKHIVEYFDNQYWIGDDPMKKLSDWLYFAPEAQKG